jgi:hypothetical protein
VRLSRTAAGCEVELPLMTRLTLRGLLGLAVLAGAAGLAYAQAPEASTMHHAHGTFEVKVQPLTPAPAEGLMRMSIDKQIHGDLEATSKGEMLSGGDPKAGAAGYVAMEVVTGKLDGKSGSFALQHLATMDAGGQKMQISVVPGSSTGELKGITGVFTIVIANGQHSYDFEYALPSAK